MSRRGPWKNICSQSERSAGSDLTKTAHLDAGVVQIYGRSTEGEDSEVHARRQGNFTVEKNWTSCCPPKSVRTLNHGLATREAIGSSRTNTWDKQKGEEIVSGAGSLLVA